MTQIQIPHNFEPRPYELDSLKALDSGIKRALLLWHRRAGKDKTAINYCAKASQQRVGSYYYFLPTYQQGRKIIWEGMDYTGFPFIGHFPKEIVASTNHTEMKLVLTNGSIFRVIGSDNIDSIVGTNPVGCVFSEYALQDPQGWDYVSPILRENGGWAIFPYTPRGKNHGYDLYQMAQSNEDWFCQKLTVEDTFKEDGSRIITEHDIEAERKAGKSEEFINQEYYCSFQSPLEGSYYGKKMDLAYDEKRICNVPYDPDLLVDTWWDLGIGDSTAIIFVQQHFNEIRVIDYFEAQGEGLPYYASVLSSKKYNYGEHIAPHDIVVKELGTGMSRMETAQKLGIPFKVARKLPIDDGINAVRSMLGQCWFDKTKCRVLIDALRHYHKEYDPRIKEWKAKPFHDWSSHACDAMRTGAVGRKRAVVPKKPDRYRKGIHNKRSWMSA